MYVFLNQLPNCHTSIFSQTASAILTFILAMVLHPDIQIRAQKEIYTVIGVGRLPDVDDRDKLPYVNAVLAETLRWHPVTPLGE